MNVETVQGPLEAEKLGFTLMHEHVMCVNWSMRSVFNKWIDRDSIVRQAVQHLLKAKKLGLKTIVDATPINLGRDINILREVSEKSGVQIIASTGLYSVDEPFLEWWTPEKIAERLLPEINDGIQGTRIKAGIIKCATETPEVSDTNRKLLQATALLQKKSGLPITTHSNSRNKNGLAQLKILLDGGANPGKLIIGHCGETTDLDYIESILDEGCYIGLDRFGLDNLLPMGSRADTLVKLCEKGYEDQIVLSHDFNTFIDWCPLEDFHQILEMVPKWSYHHVMEDVLPYIRARGVRDKQISTMTVDNPRRVFS